MISYNKILYLMSNYFVENEILSVLCIFYFYFYLREEKVEIRRDLRYFFKIL